MILQHYTYNRAAKHLEITQILLHRLREYDCCSPNSCPMLIANDNKNIWYCYDCWNMFYPEYNLRYMGRKQLLKHENLNHRSFHYRTFCPCVVARNSPNELSELEVIQTLLRFIRELIHIYEENKKNTGNKRENETILLLQRFKNFS